MKTSVRKIILIIISCILDVLIILAPVIIREAMSNEHYGEDVSRVYITRTVTLVIGLLLIRDTAHKSLK